MYKLTLYRLGAGDLIFYDTNDELLFGVARDELYTHKSCYGFCISYERGI